MTRKNCKVVSYVLMFESNVFSNLVIFLLFIFTKVQTSATLIENYLYHRAKKYMLRTDYESKCVILL